MKPPPRLFVCRCHVASMKRLVVVNSIAKCGRPSSSQGLTARAIVVGYDSVDVSSGIFRQTEVCHSSIRAGLGRFAIAAQMVMRVEDGAFLECGSHVRPQRRARFSSSCRPDGHLIGGYTVAGAPWKSVSSRHIATKIRVSRRASATTATCRPRRAASACAHARSRLAAADRLRQIVQLD